MRFTFWFILLAFAHAFVATARPLLQNSQHTHASVCLEGEEPPKRLVEICETALADQGATPTQRRDMLLSLADALYMLDLNDRAQTIVDDILGKYPNNPRAIGLSGWIDWDANRYEEAKQHFEQAVDILPTAKNLAGLASAGRHTKTMEQEQFLLLIDTALAIRPNYIWALREKGWGLIVFGEIAKAEKPFREALEINPKNQWTIYGLSYVLNEQSRYAETLEYLNQAVNENTDVITEIYSQRSLAQFYEGHYKIALQDADRVIQAWPDNAVGYVRRARALNAMGKRDFAIEELQERLLKGHDDFLAYWLADFYYNDDQNEAALKALAPVFEVGSPNYHDYEFQALLLMETKSYAAAEKAIDAAISVNSRANFPFYYRALILVDRGEFDKADVAMKQALANDLPDHRIRPFLEKLAAKGEFKRVIKWRKAQEEVNSD